MVLLKRILHITGIIIVTLLFFGSCEEKIFVEGIDCNDCFVEKPIEAPLILTLSSNNNKEVMILLYDTYFDVHKILDTIYSSDTELEIWLELEKEYALSAHYEKDKKSYIVVDRANVKVKKVSTSCDEPCWLIEDSNLDLTIKY